MFSFKLPEHPSAANVSLERDSANVNKEGFHRAPFIAGAFTGYAFLSDSVFAPTR